MAKFFFSGIGGSGMSAIAGFLAGRGNKVAGSDRSFDRQQDSRTAKILKAQGISVLPQDGSGIDASFDCIVFSTAVEADNPEFVKARGLGLPLKTRPEFLSELVSGFRTVAAAGTSGKSTTAGMLAFLLKKLGLEPNYIGGGKVRQFINDANLGNALSGSSDILVVEACESDGTIVNYHPEYAIISNLSLDHNPVEITAAMFETLGENTKKTVIINADDEHLSAIRFKNPVKFSVDLPSDFQAADIVYKPFNTTFHIHDTDFSLSLPGKYNLYNAVSCIALLAEMNVPLKEIAGILSDFKGIERRFDVHLNSGGRLVIDDYAHNPHKIHSFMQSVRNIRERVCYIFQPHGYGPTRLMKDGYIQTFISNLRASDHLVLLPIYYAGGTASRDISSEDLALEIQKAGKSVQTLQERERIFDLPDKWTAYVVFGARDNTLSDYAGRIAGRLKKHI